MFDLETMSIIIKVLVALLITFLILFATLNLDIFRLNKRHAHQDLTDGIHSQKDMVNDATIEEFSSDESADALRKKDDDLYRNADFINKNCTSIDDFIINDEINEFDLRKLADLNQIQLQISKAWYPLTLQLISELNEIGWDKKVSCIKEKYARLKFYTSHAYNSPIQKIISKYGEKSEHVCESCSERGEIRHNAGWDYVACRKHYLEYRGKLEIEIEGFNLNGNFYMWNEIQNASFSELDFNGRFKFLTIEFRNTKVNHQGWIDNKLHVSRNIIGFGNFLNYLPRTLSPLDLDYLMHFENPEFCEICGYKAVYLGACECCENDNWDQYKKKSYNRDIDKNSHILYCQLNWTVDEGEIYESKQKNYPKNPDHQVLFTDEQLQEHLDYLEDEEIE